MATNFQDVLVTAAGHVHHAKTHKITVVGVGAVGMACAYSILSKGAAGELVLCDIAEDRLRGEVMDLQHCGSFLSGKVTQSSKDYKETANSDIIVVTAGVRQQVGESRLSLIQRNLKVFESIIPPLVKLSPDTVFIVVSNPVDILAYITWKLSGLPFHRVIGSGTYLDSSRFRSLIASELDVSAQSVHGWIVGEHGDSSVPVWSGVNVAGAQIVNNEEDKTRWGPLHEQVVSAAYEVIQLKGYTNWAIGAAVCTLCQAVFKDERRVVPVSTLVNGFYGIDQDVYLSLPCVLGRSGIQQIVNLKFAPEEEAQFKQSASSLLEVQAGLPEIKSA